MNDRCNCWMPNAKTTCARCVDHYGQHLTAKAHARNLAAIKAWKASHIRSRHVQAH